METKKYIAFQTVDPENDIWCNIALLFENEADVNEFFLNPKKVFKTLKIKINKNEEISDCIEVFNYPNGDISAVVIETSLTYKKRISRMAEGVIITNH